MQRGAASRYRHYGDVFREIIRKDGMRGLYCGIVPEYAKVRLLMFDAAASHPQQSHCTACSIYIGFSSVHVPTRHSELAHGNAQVIPGVAIAFCSYELMKKVLGVRVNITNR